MFPKEDMSSRDTNTLAYFVLATMVDNLYSQGRHELKKNEHFSLFRSSDNDRESIFPKEGMSSRGTNTLAYFVLATIIDNLCSQ
jgi:hypothetical protein